MSQREEFTDAMTKAIKATQRAIIVGRLIKVAGGGVGLAARFFGVPFLAMYAWNGMSTLPDWPYWPTVAAFAVLNVLASTLLGPKQ